VSIFHFSGKLSCPSSNGVAHTRHRGGSGINAIFGSNKSGVHNIIWFFSLFDLIWEAAYSLPTTSLIYFIWVVNNYF
jgi:hypothetical protein